ncbi:pyroglutamylated RF-amide peptide receptor-like [Anneissia japonica]|uniref:pyroglutamylated RF-amide peptide receptor-like n=1 Tax=Anneissia japonica TaxID=1529436 RepID=UPI001425703A|nr:pyroglutamylated RF-amide peptide receptor-like [Anneissia japonica]
MVFIHQCRQLKGAPAMLLVSLAVADFLVCIIIVPSEVYLYNVEYNLGPFTCRIFAFLNQLVFTISSFTLTLISIERLYVIKHPFQARAVITRRRARFMIVGSWLIAVLCSIPNAYRQEHMIHVQGIKQKAVCIPSTMQPWKKLNAIFDFLVKFTIPVLIMAISYSVAVVILYKSTRQSEQLQSMNMLNNKTRTNVATKTEITDLTIKPIKSKAKKTKSEKHQDERNQTIVMLLIVVLLYFITWGPFMVYQLMRRFDVFGAHYYFHPRLIFTTLKMLGIGNSCINPFVYVFTLKSFRSTITTTLCFHKGPNSTKKRIV